MKLFIKKIVNIVIGQSKIVNIVIGQSKTCVTTISSPGFRHISVQWAEPTPLENRVAMRIKLFLISVIFVHWSWLRSCVKSKTESFKIVIKDCEEVWTWQLCKAPPCYFPVLTWCLAYINQRKKSSLVNIGLEQCRTP